MINRIVVLSQMRNLNWAPALSQGLPAKSKFTFNARNILEVRDIEMP